MLIVNKYVYDWFVSSKFPRLGGYTPPKDINIHKIINLNAGISTNTTPLSFLKSMQSRGLSFEKQLTAYYMQESNYYIPDADPRRLLAGRILRKYKKKNRK